MSGSLPLDCSMDMVKEAQGRLRGLVRHTPVMSSVTLSERAGAQLFFKCENFQKTGAFKIRGALNAVLGLDADEARRGVVTHSSGNHGAALSYAAHLRNIPAYIVLPRNAPKSKVEAVARYGGKLTFCDPTPQARSDAARHLVDVTGAAFVPSSDDVRVIAGQGTVGLEMVEDIQELDVVLCPVGGGGLLSGVATAVKSINPRVRVIGVEPEAADDAYRSFKSGTLASPVASNTIADGLRVPLSPRTFRAIQRFVDDIITVRDEQIVEAMRYIAKVMKLVVEPSAAVAYSAVKDGSEDLANMHVGIIVSGGNLNLDAWP